MTFGVNMLVVGLSISVGLFTSKAILPIRARKAPFTLM